MEVAQDFLECSMGRAKPSPSVDSNEDSLPRFAGSSLTDATPSVSPPPQHTHANEQQQQQRQGSVGALRQSMTTVIAPSSGLGARSGSHAGGAGASVIGSSLTFATFSKVDEDDPHGNNSFALSRQQTQRRQTSFAAQPRKSMVSKSFRPKMDDKSTQVTTAMHFLSSERGIALQELGARAVEHIYEAHRRKEDYLIQKESVLLENIPEVEEQEGGDMPPSREVVALVMRDASDDDGSDTDDGPIQDALRAGCSEDECMALRAVHNRLRQFSTLMACFLEKVSNAPKAAAEHANAIREFTKSWVGEPLGVLPKAMHKAFEAARADEEVLVTAIRQDLESALRSTTTSQEQRVEKLQDAAGRQKALFLRRVQREEHRAELLREGQDRLLHLWNERSIDDDAVENDLALRSEALVESCRAILGKLFLYIAKAVEPTSGGGVDRGESNANGARASTVSAPLRSPFVLNGTFLGGERQRTSLGLLPSRPGITLHEALQQHRKQQQLHAETELPLDEPEGGIPLITEDALVRSYLQAYPDTLEHVAIPRDFDLLRRMANEQELQELLRLREVPEEQWFFGTDELTYLRELFLKRYAAEEKRRIDDEMQSRRAEGSRKLTMELRQVAEQAKAAAKLKGLGASAVGTNSAASTGMRSLPQQSHSLRENKGAGGGSSSMIMGGSASNPPILQSIAQTTSEGSSALERSLPMPPLSQGVGSGEGAAAALGVDLFSHNASSITPRQPVFKALSSPGGTVLSVPTHTLVSPPPPALATEDSLKGPPPPSNQEREGIGATGLSTTAAAPTTDPKLLLKTQTAVALKGAEDAVHRVVEELHRVTANESPSADVLTQEQKKASVRVNSRRSPPKASGCGSPVGGCITISGGHGGAAVTLDAAIGGTHTFLFQPPQTVAAATLSPSAADPTRVDITIDVHPAGTTTTMEPPPTTSASPSPLLTKSSSVGKVRSAPPLGSHNNNKNVLRPVVSHQAQLSAATVGVNVPPQPQQQRATSSSSAIKPSLTKGRSTSHLLLPSTTAEEIVMQRRHHHHQGSSTMPAAAGGRAPPLPPHPSSAQYRSEEAALLQQATQLAMRSSSPAQGPLPNSLPLVVECDDNNESPSQLAQRLMVESMIYARSTRNLPGGGGATAPGVEPTVTIPTGALPRPHNNNMLPPEHSNGVVAPPSVSLMPRNKRYEQLTKPVTRHVPASVNSLTEQRYRSHNTMVAHQELGESDAGLDRVAPLPSFAGSRRSTAASGASRTGGAGGPSFSQFVADRRAMTSAQQHHHHHHPQHSAMDFFGGPAGEFASQIEHARDEEEPSFFTLPLDGVGDHFPLFAPQPHVALAPLPQRNTPVMCRPTSLAMGGGSSQQQRVGHPQQPYSNPRKARPHNHAPGIEEGMEGDVSRTTEEADVVHHMVAVDARATAVAVAKPQFAYLMP